MADDLTAPASLSTQQQPVRPSLLGVLFAAESGGHNVANTTEGTSSGQAQGFFQITTGTWDEFGGRQYAPTPLQANYEQQAAVASQIPLARWDPKTVAAIRAHYPQIDPRATLGQNVAAAGGNFAANAPGNAHDSQFKIASNASGSAPGSYSLVDNTYTPRPPQNFLDSFDQAVTETADKKAEAAKTAAAAPKPQGPLIGQVGNAPLGLKPGQPAQPAPQPVPKPMDYYLALLKKQGAPEGAA